MATTVKQRLGAYGEALAARHLVSAGMTLLDHNWRGDGGELDLILRDDRTLVARKVTIPVDNVVGKVFALVWPVKRFDHITRPDAFKDVPDAP